MPPGIAFGNGRVEAKLVDVAAKEPLRVKEVLVDEGQLVKPGDILVRLDTSTLDSQLLEAKASAAATEERAAAEKAQAAKTGGGGSAFGSGSATAPDLDPAKLPAGFEKFLGR